MTDFFDRFPRFYETSGVGAWPHRLSCRYEAIVNNNRGIFDGARVLDLASHDGRWSMAALDAGATHVTGVEARPTFVEAAITNFEFYGVARNRYAFMLADLNHLTDAQGKYDVVLCLGYFYHTINHMALFEYLRSTEAEYLILDGMVEPVDEPVIKVYAEDITSPGNGISNQGTWGGQIMVGHPSPTALGMMLSHAGYGGTFYDWQSLLSRRRIPFHLDREHGPDNPLGDYARGARVTIVASKQR